MDTRSMWMSAKEVYRATKNLDGSTTMFDLETADILDAAADLYESEQYDWCQMSLSHTAENGKVISVCASGAIAIASQYWDGHKVHPERSEANREGYNALKVAIQSLTGDETDYVEGWNDFKAVVKEEVIELMKATAKDIRNAHTDAPIN